MTETKLNFVFFGTDEFAVGVLSKLLAKGYKPSLVVTTPDKPQGRKMLLTPPPVKLWAEENSIECIQPAKLSSPEFLDKLPATSYQLFVVASYGKIIPTSLLTLPKHGILNVHPSLLPRHRGPSPLETTILEGDPETGVSIMLVDEQVDHGPIIKIQKSNTKVESCYYQELRDELAKLGGQILAEVIPKWVNGEIKAEPQDDTQATFTKKITKAEGEIDLAGDPELNYRKIRAFSDWPGAYFYIERKRNVLGSRIPLADREQAENVPLERVRISIKKAHLEDNQLILDRVIPEGKHEMNWDDYKRNI